MHPSFRNRDVMNNKFEEAALTSSDDSTVTTGKQITSLNTFFSVLVVNLL